MNFDDAIEITISRIEHEILASQNLELSLLRLDTIHPQISGNKWFKLKNNISNALNNHIECIVSFGGAYSNHLHALAYTCHKHKLKCIAYVRGEVNSSLNHTIQDCVDWGMEIIYISREDYKKKLMFHL